MQYELYQFPVYIRVWWISSDELMKRQNERDTKNGRECAYFMILDAI